MTEEAACDAAVGAGVASEDWTTEKAVVLGATGGVGGCLRFLGPTNQVAIRATGQRKKANKAQPRTDRFRCLARTAQRRIIPDKDSRPIQLLESMITTV